MAAWYSQDMKTVDIAFASYIYSKMTDYDDSYERFRKGVSNPLDLSSELERQQTLVWLNKWGCRQFAVEYHALASEQIALWYATFKEVLVPPSTALLDLSQSEISEVATAFEDLSVRQASERKGTSGARIKVRIGPTGAAKILFALRPSALLPWDMPIRDSLEQGGVQFSYAEYLLKAKQELQELIQDCKNHGVAYEELPRLAGRPKETIAKLIDEFFWVTISRNCPVPPVELIKQWSEWT